MLFFNRSLTAKAIQSALLIPSLFAIYSTELQASEEATEEEAKRITVTGSRIKRTAIEGANPITVISQDDILRSGMTNVGELLQRLPEITGSPLSTTVNNGGNGSVGIDIRGLNRTLVLVNGRRAPDGGDFQTIPAAMIERIDILKDGASAVYGSDAIAGVVNIVTRKDFTGMELTAQTSNYSNTDAGKQDQISLVVGSDSDKGHYLIGIDWSKQEGIYQSETPWDFMQNSFFFIDDVSLAQFGPLLQSQDPINFNLSPFGSSRITQGNFDLQANTAFSSLAGCGSVTTNRGADGSNSTNYRCYNGNFTDPNNDSYNYAPVNYLQTPYERTNLFFEADYEISDNHSFFSEMRVSQRLSTQQLAPVPYDTRFDPGYEVEILDIVGAPTGITANGISGQNYYNPFDEDIIRSRRRMAESARVFKQDVTQFQYVVGLQGYLTETWEYELSYNYGYRHRTDQDSGQYSGERLSLALGPSFLDTTSNQVVCGTPAAPIANCVSLNLFGDTGTVTQEMLDYIQVTLVDQYTTELEVYNGFVTGDIFELPGGTASMVLGYEHQKNSFDFEPDSGKETEAVTGNTGAGVGGSFTNTSYFAEILLPIVDTLEASIGLRSDDYSTGSDKVSTQVGLQFRPNDEWLIRGTVGESFRAPNTVELFSPLTDAFPAVTDPCNTANWAGLTPQQQSACIAQGVPDGGAVQSDSQLLVKVGGNPDLGPEDGESLTFGIVWSPDFLEGFRMTVDYWDISVDNIISQVSANSILNSCINTGSNCDAINRFANGSIDFIQANNLNLAKREANGIDWNLVYSMNTDIGAWKFNLLFTQLKDRTEIEFAGAEPWELAGVYDDLTLGGAFPENKFQLTTEWTHGDFAVSYNLNFIDSVYQNLSFFGTGVPCANGRDEIATCYKVDSQMYHDIVGTYTVPDLGTRMTLGVTNLTDEAPPFIDSGFNASTDPSTYRLFGQGWFFRVSHDF
ncbi:TonB-dependent receptor [Aliikangiella marina]|uniref:TonB-dependent receptor n=1 Tax=Aliikangiella marina TaxID=1712262 RepID=A0A545T164_9GAMM|nr:TonB-dependent receptor [Aliikangiella marina]TQV70957.1 TonB-dependent receptor [Aliikangiella marina]